MEIPSVEGPEALGAVFDAADALGITVNRVSQGSGAMLLSEAELREMARTGADRGIEVSSVCRAARRVGPGGVVQAPDGPGFAGRVRGTSQLRYAFEDVQRATEQGIRGFLVADSGLLELLADSQRRGEIPSETVWKVSALMAPTNPATFAQLERLGASTINVPSDMTLGQLGEMRSVSELAN